MRVALARISEREVQVVWTFRHVLLDGWSMFQVLSDVFACHAALARGKDPAEEDLGLPRRRPFRDHVEWMKAQDERHAEAYWRKLLSDLSRSTPLPYDRPPAENQATCSSEACLLELEQACGPPGSIEKLDQATLTTLESDSAPVWFFRAIDQMPPSSKE